MSEKQIKDLGSMSPEEIDALLKEKMQPQIERSLKFPSGRLKHPYVVPGDYDEAWDWDSYFISEALAGYPDLLPHIRGTVENFFAEANEQGRIPRWIHPTRSFWNTSLYDTKFTMDLAKPFMAQMAWVYSRQTGDFEWFRPYLKLEREFLQIWHKERGDSEGLHVWASGLEAGCDDEPDVFMWPDFTVQGVDLATFIVREYLAAANICLNLDEYSLFKYFVSRARYLLYQIEDFLYDPDTNRYYNRDKVNKRLIRMDTQLAIYPLYLGNFLTLDRERRQVMIRDYVLDPERLWSPWGIRAISKKEPTYNNLLGNGPSNWHGPIWGVVNHIYQMILIDNGFKEEALELATKAQKLYLRDLMQRGIMAECYHAETGDPLVVEGFVGWNALSVHMFDDAKAGFARSIIDPFQKYPADRVLRLSGQGSRNRTLHYVKESEGGPDLTFDEFTQKVEK